MMAGIVSSGWRMGLLAAVAAALVLGISLASLGEPSAAWVPVARRELTVAVAFSGELRAVRVVEYGPPTISGLWSYKISAMAPEGARVDAGDAILRFDTSELEQRLRRNTADRDAAQKSHERRKKDLDILLGEESLKLSEAETRVQRTSLVTETPPDVVARSELEKARIDLEVARDEVEYRRRRMKHLRESTQAELLALAEERDRAAAAVAEIEQKIALMTVRAVRGGIVMYVANRRGEKKSLGDTCWRGERVVQIPELDEMTVSAWVEEADAGPLRPGLTAEIRLDARPDVRYPGSVRSVQRTVERRSLSDRRRVVRLDLEVTEADPLVMRPGMRVQGSILVDTLPAALSIPVGAPRRGKDGPFVIVKTLVGGDARDIELGRRLGEWVEVVAGLEEGERVRVSG